MVFLMTRAKSPNEDDWAKVKQLLGHLKGTIYMPLIFLADSLRLLHWWVNDAYASTMIARATQVLG
jgi:hypothetical protein